MRSHHRLPLAPRCLAGLLLLSAHSASSAPPSPADIEFFEKQVRPVLIESCGGCHGAAAGPPSGGLRLDRRDGLLKGGTRGPAIVPGRPEQSRIIHAIRYADPSLRMPPAGRLSEASIAAIAEWVRRGAPWPSDDQRPRGRRTDTTNDQQRGRDVGRWSLVVGPTVHWAFRAPITPPLPKVKAADWVRSPLDRFILAALEAKGLAPAPPADRRTLIRRATFDLTGLPPTPEEIAAFLADRSPDAFANVVDRLLASPRYGERWGRHWLDVARYADSNGLDENLAYASAFRYRDYVVAAFNRDTPYNRFIQEQLAGDLLPKTDDVPTDHERLIATGFLSLGGKMLAEDDPVKMEMDIIDEQVDTVGRAFMGLTIGCARCHDHKFDPISTSDYYALAGIFKSTKTMENFNVVARWHEHSLAPKEDEERLRAHEKKIEETQAAIEERKKGLKEGEAEDATLKSLRTELRRLERTRPVLPTAMGVTEGPSVTNLRIHLRGSHLTLGEEAPRRFPTILAGERQTPLGAGQSGRYELARWLAHPGHPLTSRVMVNRIWRWHFGAGIVRSVDNFGRLGDPPTHPELLDWLARRFVNSGWSVKAMHRLLMLSSTYQMSSAYNARAARVDPENRFHWRMNRRRLEAEAIRDAILAVSGALDTTMGGSLLRFKNRDYVTSTASRDETGYDHNRRSVYLPVVRSALYELFQAFDFGDPSVSNGDRATTTVAPQALFMMNSPLVLKQTRQMAAALLAEPGLDDAGRVARIYEKALGRPPTNRETERALGFVRRLQAEWAVRGADAEERRLRAWQSFCRVLIASNEFVYVE
jgi:hypothetical protein